MASRKKSDKITFLTQLSLAAKTGELIVGYNTSLSSIVTETAKCIVLANNVPKHQRTLVEYYTALSKEDIQVRYFSGNNNELQKLLNLPHRSSVVSILNVGEADMLLQIE